MSLYREPDFSTRGYSHHKGTDGLFENHWLNLAFAIILAIALIALLLWCCISPSPELIQPTTTPLA